MDISPIAAFLIALSTLVGETFGTMFGGGSFVTQPALLLAGLPAASAVANDVTAAAFSSAAYLWTTRRDPHEQVRPVLGMLMLVVAPLIVLGTAVGARVLTSVPESSYLLFMVGVCCFGLVQSLVNLRSFVGGNQAGSQPFRSNWQAILVLGALVLGLYDGVSGAGSGVLALFIVGYALRTSMRTTIFLANVLSCISLGAAAISFFSLGLLSLPVLAIMVPASLVAGALAGRLTTILPERWLRMAYALVISGLLVFLVMRLIGS